MSEQQTRQKLKTMFSNGGGEYAGEDFSDFLEENGLEHNKTCAYTPLKKVLAEEMNRELLEMV